MRNTWKQWGKETAIPKQIPMRLYAHERRPHEERPT